MAWRKRVARGAKPPHFICTSRGENKRRCGLLLLLLLLVELLLVLKRNWRGGHSRNGCDGWGGGHSGAQVWRTSNNAASISKGAERRELLLLLRVEQGGRTLKGSRRRGSKCKGWGYVTSSGSLLLNSLSWWTRTG